MLPGEGASAPGRAAVPTDGPESLERLIAAVATGDRAAFRQLYQATSAKLYGVALRVLQRRALADECLQEVYVRVWHAAPRYASDKGAVMTWLITIARNRALDLKRRERPATSLDDAPEVADLGDEALDALALTEQASDARRLKACLEQLEAEPKRCVLLAFWQGLTHEELASRLDRPLGTIKSWVRRSLLRLKDCLAT